MTIQMRKLCVGLFACIIALTTVGCSTAPVQKGELIEPAIFTPERVLAEGVVYAGDIYDPWEGFNRAMYRFNYRFDKYVFLPAVNTYKFITPDPIEKGFHNFFNNIRDITTLVNSILQLNLTKTMNTTTRLMVNTGIGLLGFIDVASDVPRVNEDFGQTLGYWGVGKGPYLVLPILGPSSLRDGFGTGVDAFALSAARNEVLEETWQELTWSGLNAIDLRSHTAFRYYETGSPSEYGMVRMLYNTKRQLDIER